MMKNKTGLFATALLICLALFPLPTHADPYSWSMTIGGTGDDRAQSIQQTADGGYIAAGYTSSFGAGANKAWVLKVNADGTVAWQNTYDGQYDEQAHSVQQTADGGYIVAGYTNSFGSSGYDAWVMKLNATGSVDWQKTYGGSNTEYAYSVRQTADGGYIVAGAVKSYGAGGFDAWVLKLNADGSVAWQKTYGGALDDYAQSIQQTADGGYIVAGYTLSTGAGNNDAWVLKLNADGSVAWQKTYGGASDDRAYSVQQTADGGYIVAGYTNSFGAGSTDAWVLKLNADGSVAWQKTYGGSNDDRAYSVQQTADGGYIVAGYTASSGAGSADAWVLKLNADGGVAWQKTYGGTGEDHANSIQQTADGGYIVAGYTASTGAGSNDAWVLKLDSRGRILGCTTTAIADSSATVVNTSVTGTTSTATVTATAVAPYTSVATVTAQTAVPAIQCAYTAASAKWQKTYGGSGFDVAKSVEQTTDGGYIVAGYTDSSGAGSQDVWVLKLNADGTVNWQKTYGGTSDDYANSVQQTADGGYIVAGYSGSFAAGSAWIIKLNAAGTVTWQKEYESGCVEAHSIKQTKDGGYIVAGWGPAINANSDAWVMKLTSDGSVTWQRAYGGDAHEEAFSIQQTADGGYIFAGFTESFGAGNADAWVMKLNSDGTIAWQKTYGGAADDYARSIQQTADGGYIVAGFTYSFGTDVSAAWVLKLDANGNVGPAYPGTWQKIYGGTNNDTAYAIQQTTDGGYIVAGSEYPNASSLSAWVMKLNADGGAAWQNTFSGVSTFQAAYAVRQTVDSGYIVAGYYNSGSGNDNGWVMKLDQKGGITGCSSVVPVTTALQSSSGTVGSTTVSPIVPAAPTVATTTAATGIPVFSPVNICSADYTQYILDYFREGNGTGNVTSSPAGINCSGDCSGYFSAGTVTLNATPGPGTLPVAWDGACNSSGQVTMNADKSCTATFSCSHDPVNIGGTSNYYSSIQTAYTAAGDSNLLLQAQVFYETLNLSSSINVKLIGGYGCDYSSNPGRSTLFGSMTIRGGKVTVDKLTIR